MREFALEAAPDAAPLHNSGSTMQPHHRNDGDPVSYHGSWGFYDEAWTSFYNGFPDEGTARAACSRYATNL